MPAQFVRSFAHAAAPYPNAAPATGAAGLAQLVTVAIINRDGEKVLPRTLDALLALGTGCRIVLIDDGSTDATVDLVRRRFPSVEPVELGPSTSRIGRARRRAVEECRTPYLMLMDNDVTLAPGSIERLLEHLQDRPRALSCRPRLVYADRPEVIYQDANSLHYLALAADQRRDRPIQDGLTPVPRPTLGGGIMLLNCAIARAVGNFDARYLFGWGDDLELDVRARLLGFEVLHDPLAIGYHAERPPGLSRVVGQLYNRRRFIGISYSRRSLLVLGPALLAFEVVVLIMCLVNGYGRQYLEALKLLRIDAAEIRARRRRVQATRTQRSDDAVLNGGRISITGRMAQSGRLVRLGAVLSTCFALYWRVTAPLLRVRRAELR